METSKEEEIKSKKDSIIMGGNEDPRGRILSVFG